MKLEIKKWIHDGKFAIQIEGALTAEEQKLIDEFGDMTIDLSDCKSSKSHSKLSDFSASGKFRDEQGAKDFVKRVSNRLKVILNRYKELSGDFDGTEVHDIHGLRFEVTRKLKNRSFNLHLTTTPDDKIQELIEKYGNQDIDVSSDRFTAHIQTLTPQSPTIRSLRIDKTFDNAVDAYQYRDKIKSQLEEVIKKYLDKTDAFSGKEETEI